MHPRHLFTRTARACRALIISAGLAAAAGSPAAWAQALDIDDPGIEKGQSAVKSVNLFNRGLARSGDAPHSAHELSIEHNPRDWLKLTAHIEFDHTTQDGFLADHIGLESQFLLRKAPDAGGLDIGWINVLQLSADTSTTNSVVFGPILKLSQGPDALILNPYLQKTFGRNSTPGMAFSYGWQARHEFTKGVSLGLEGFGTIDDIANAPPASEQDHRIGPALFIEWPAADKRTITLDIGVLVGLTDASPDTSFKATLGTSF